MAKTSDVLESKQIPLVQDFLNFLKSPINQIDSGEKLTTTNKLWRVFEIVAFSGVLSYLMVLITNYITNFLGYSQEENNKVGDFINQYPVLVSLLFIVVIGPLIEELAFRMPLTIIKNTFYLGVYFLIYFLSPLALELTNLSPDSKGNINFITVVLMAPLFLYLSVYVNFEPIKKLIEKYFTFWVYLLSIIFGFVHLGNYENFNRFWYLVPLLVISQIFAGFVFAFVRLKYGFLFAWFAHSAYNFIFSISLFLYSLVLGADKLKTIAALLNSGKLEEFNNLLSQGDKFSITVINLTLAVTYTFVFYIFLKNLWQYFRWISKRT